MASRLVHLLFTISLLLYLTAPAIAAQGAVAIRDSVNVYTQSDIHSSVIATLPKGAAVQVSSKFFRDKFGTSWYKAKLASGDIGYVVAREVLTDTSKKEILSAGIQPTEIKSYAAKQGFWFVALRAGGLGGYLSQPQGWSVGGEGELAFTLPFGETSRHRSVALGAAYVFATELQAVLGSIVYRLYSETKAIPEIRLRFGADTLHGSPAGGLNVGVSYPFSITTGPHLSAYIEGAGLILISETSAVHLWLSTGISFHL